MAALRHAGVTGLVGVPCGHLEPLVAAARESGMEEYQAADEGEAVAFSAGSWLAGRRVAVFMQNSGLGNAVNPIASLALPYRIPLLLIVSWRGEPGSSDALHHHPMGSATLPILRALSIPHHVLGELAAGSADEVLAAPFVDRMVRALVVQADTFAVPPAGEHRRPSPDRPGRAEPVKFGGSARPSRRAALAAIGTAFPDAPLIATTGLTSRGVFALGDRDQHFYMQGSMGHALPIGLGIATAAADPDQPVVVVDGDGALIMRLGALTTVGLRRPAGLAHVLLDNGAYASTGGQPTAAAVVDFAALALAAGYARAASVDDAAALPEATAWLAAAPGPSFLRIGLAATEDPKLPRPSVEPPEIAARFRAYVLRQGVTDAVAGRRVLDHHS